MTLTHTHTKTYNVIEFADPYKTCDQCGEWIDGVLDSPNPINVPCEHQAGYSDRCPSWSPVDGCQCIEQLGHRPHPERPRGHPLCEVPHWSDQPPRHPRGEAVIEVGSLPDRKSKAICVRRGSLIWPVAYFRDEESYQRFREALGDHPRLEWDDGNV